MGKPRRIKDRVIVLVALLAAGMAGQTRFRDGMERGPGWLDVIFLGAIAVVVVALGRGMARSASEALNAHLDAHDGGDHTDRPVSGRAAANTGGGERSGRNKKKRRSKDRRGSV